MFKPKKSLGQNFLSDSNVLNKIIDKANIGKGSVVLEIGPGQGSLTYALCKNAKEVIAVEKDQELFRYLVEKFKKVSNVKFVKNDILVFIDSIEFKKLFSNKKWIVVANIPYYLTSHLIQKLISLDNRPSEIILMVQKEVAERIVAQEGDMSILAISVQLYAKPEILFNVNKNSFWPAPKVDSAVIKLKVSNNGKLDLNEEDFFELVKAGFSAKRKILVNNLSKKLNIPKENICAIFKEANINISARPQDLSLVNWIFIYEKIYKKN